MKHTPLGLGSLCLLAVALSVLSSCKRDLLLSPPTGAPQEVAVTRSALFAGQPGNLILHVAVVYTFAGGSSVGFFREPTAVAADKDGNVYVADQDNNAIKKFNSGGQMIAAWGNGIAGYKDGPAPTGLSFNAPAGVAVGPDGRVFVADLNNNRIRIISADGKQVTTLAGDGQAAFKDGQGIAASFNKPAGIAVDGTGTVYVADYGNNMIRRISSTGLVSRFAGQTTAGRVDAALLQASFNGPQGITITSDGIIYVADINNHRIRKLASGSVSTLAGSGAVKTVDGTQFGASFNFPAGIAADASGNVYVTEKGGNSAIRFVTSNGVVTTVAGGVMSGFKNSYDIDAQFSAPTGITIDRFGNLFIADRLNQVVRKMFFNPAVKTLAGNGSFGYREGTGAGAIIQQPRTVAVAPDGSVYTMDASSRIRKITPSGVTSLVAGDGFPGFRDNVSAAQAEFSELSNIAVGIDGTVYVADGLNNRVRQIKNGVVTTLAGNGANADVVGHGTAASIAQPQAIAIDPTTGDIYVTTQHTGLVVKITPAGDLSHRFQLDHTANGYPQINAIVIDAGKSRIYLASSLFHTLYMIVPQPRLSHLKLPAQVVFGGFNSNGTFIRPDFNPGAMALNIAKGSLYFVDNNVTIKFLSTDFINPLPVFVSGTSAGFKDGPEFNGTKYSNIAGLAYNQAGILYSADYGNNRIRMAGTQ